MFGDWLAAMLVWVVRGFSDKTGCPESCIIRVPVSSVTDGRQTCHDADKARAPLHELFTPINRVIDCSATVHRINHRRTITRRACLRCHYGIWQRRVLYDGIIALMYIHHYIVLIRSLFTISAKQSLPRENKAIVDIRLRPQCALAPPTSRPILITIPLKITYSP